MIVWLLFVVACAVVVSRTSITTDVSAFLPRSPTPEQHVLVDQLREGVVSRLILAAIEGGAPEARAQASRQLAGALRREAAFAVVNNGENAGWEKDRAFLWRHRYLISPAVTPGRFSVEALRARLEEHLHLLASPAGSLLRPILPADPTGELLHLLERTEGQSRPATRDGVWISRDGNRALLIIQTRAAGYDMDAQEQALGRIRAAFARVAGERALRLRMTGPAVFSVASRDAIRGDALRFSLIALCAIGAMGLAFFRSGRALGLALVPVLTGALAGVAAVSLGFGTLHGVTLGFGITLLGEGVDYAIYLLAQAAPGTPPARALDRIWPTLRLGVLTSLCGFSAMLFSDFSGLAQLGLFSSVGLVVAVVVTRWLLPAWVPPGYSAPAVPALASRAQTVLRAARALRYPLLGLAVAGAAFLGAQRDALWSDDLAALTPVPREELLLDGQLRSDLGAPDVRYLVVIRSGTAEEALQAAEAAGAVLARAVEKRQIAGFESPALWLPSRKAQEARRAALPPGPELSARLDKALHGLPYRPGTFGPFLEDVEATRSMPLVERASLDGTNFAIRADSLLARRGGQWSAMLPLRGVTDAERLARELTRAPGAVLVDLKGESERLYAGYRREAVTHALLGAAAIILLLIAGLRSLRRVLDVLAPLVAAVIATTAVLALVGKLSVFHLIGLLLIVAVGSNYSLFFERGAASSVDSGRTVPSLLFACASTVVGFGLLALSSVPVLSAIGLTVGMGATMALVFAAVLSRRPDEPS